MGQVADATTLAGIERIYLGLRCSDLLRRLRSLRSLSDLHAEQWFSDSETRSIEWSSVPATSLLVFLTVRQAHTYGLAHADASVFVAGRMRSV
jgi:hypothetical protein